MTKMNNMEVRHADFTNKNGLKVTKTKITSNST